MSAVCALRTQNRPRGCVVTRLLASMPCCSISQGPSRVVPLHRKRGPPRCSLGRLVVSTACLPCRVYDGFPIA